jgi:hypothetical protein
MKLAIGLEAFRSEGVKASIVETTPGQPGVLIPCTPLTDPGRHHHRLVEEWGSDLFHLADSPAKVSPRADSRLQVSTSSLPTLKKLVGVSPSAALPGEGIAKRPEEGRPGRNMNRRSPCTPPDIRSKTDQSPTILAYAARAELRPSRAAGKMAHLLARYPHGYNISKKDLISAIL